MKGIVFTEFNEMVESHLRPEIADRISMRAAHTCTAAGTCDHQELIDLLPCPSKVAGTRARDGDRRAPFKLRHPTQ